MEGAKCVRQNYAEKIAVFRCFLAKSCTNWYVNVSNDEKLFLIFLIIFIFYFTQKLHIFILETIEIVWVFFKSVRLSCREQICSNLLATVVWGHILSKENDCLCQVLFFTRFIFPLLFRNFPTNHNQDHDPFELLDFDVEHVLLSVIEN